MLFKKYFFDHCLQDVQKLKLNISPIYAFEICFLFYNLNFNCLSLKISQNKSTFLVNFTVYDIYTISLFYYYCRKRPSSINMKKLNIFHPKKRPNSQELPTAPTDTLGRIVNAKEEV